MQSNSSTRRFLSLLAGLALLAPAATAQQGAALRAETFGSASGDVPLPGLGLVLELVDGQAAEPRLRLFGGAPGHPATLLVSTQRSDAPVAGPRNTRFLVGPVVHTIEGSFDGRGIFEVPLAGLADLSDEGRVYAQGVHTGLLQFLDGPLVQASHGIELARRVEQTDPLGFDDLLPHLPDDRELAGFEGLAELIQGALDSERDSLRLAIEIDGSVGLGIEVADVKVGAKIAVEFTVTRTEQDLYEVAVGADLALLAGASVGTGVEAGAEGSQGLGATAIYHFHSAPGAARGVLGMGLALAFPAFSPGGDWLDSDVAQQALEHLAGIYGLLNELEAHSIELEAFLFGVADAQVAKLQTLHSQALKNLATAQTALKNAAWHQVPVRVAQVAIQKAIVAASSAAVKVATNARAKAQQALDQVRANLEAKRAEVDAVVQGLARFGRIATAVAQLRPYTVEHFDGEELRGTQALELEAKLGLPFVDVKGLESSVTGTVEKGVHARIEREKGDRPLRVTLIGSTQKSLELVGASIAGVELARTRTIEIAQTFERGVSGWQAANSSLSWAVDAHALTSVGLGYQVEQGVGRAWSVSLSDEMLLAGGGLESISSLETLMESVGTFEVGMELQDRRQKNRDFAFSIDISGNGGGIDIAAEWADQGRRLSRSTTVAEAATFVLEAATQVIDVHTGNVTQLN